jgi:hypothetical protein
MKCLAWDHTGKVGRHEERFQPWQLAGVQLLIQEPQEVQKVGHCLLNLRYFQPTRQDRLFVEASCAQRARRAGSKFFHELSPGVPSSGHDHTYI